MLSETGFIYGLVHANEVRYVGKTIQEPGRRLIEHYSDARSDVHGQRYLLRWIRNIDYSASVVVFEECAREELNEAEKSWIATLRRYGCRLTNTTDGGDGQTPGYKHTDAARARQSAAQRGKKMPPRSVAWRKAQSEAKRGKKLSPETCAKLSAAQRGKPHVWSEEGKRSYAEKNSGPNNPMYGKPAWNRGKKGVSEETRARMSASAKARTDRPRHTEESRRKISESRRGTEWIREAGRLGGYAKAEKRGGGDAKWE